MLPFLVLAAFFGGAYYLLKIEQAPFLTPEQGVPVPPVGFPFLNSAVDQMFALLPLGGVTLTDAGRAALVASMRASSLQVSGFFFQAGEMTVGPIGLPPSDPNAGLAVDVISDELAFNDVWISNMAIIGHDALVLFVMPGHSPLMNTAMNEPPLAGSIAQASDLSRPAMVRFGVKGTKI